MRSRLTVQGSLALLCLAVVACASNEPAARLADAGRSTDSGVPMGADGAAPRSDASPFSDAGVSGDGGIPIVDECDPMAQTGCQAPATKCVVENATANGGASCVMGGMTEAALGAACHGQDCLPGLACVRSSTQAGSTCVKVCQFRTGAGCEPLGDEYECRTRITGSNWGACVMLQPPCDPATQVPCPPDRACSTFLRQTGTWEFRCRAAGTQDEGRPCGSSGGGECMRGLTCVTTGPAGPAVCRRFCTLSRDCPMPATCSGSVRDPPFMYCST